MLIEVRLFASLVIGWEEFASLVIGWEEAQGNFKEMGMFCILM